MIRDTPKTGALGAINYNSLQIAKIKSSEDDNHTGRLQVWLAGSNTDETDPANWITVKYSSPMAGISDPSKMSSSGIQSQSSSQSSYGFFAVPPDKENIVLVAFANGDPSEGYWMGSAFSDGMTTSIGKSATSTYQGSKPGVEMNRFSQQLSTPQTHPTVPADEKFSGALDEQGTAGDPLLGAGQSNIWRDKSPSMMGWTSPSGNQFIMDDKDGYQLIRIRTASGVQLLLSETTGDIFMISKSGNGWMKVGNDGNVDMYSSVGVNLYGGSDINMSAGANINLEAGGDINIKAGGNVNNEGGLINLKAGVVNSSFINGDVAFASTAGAAPVGAPAPVGDTAGSAGSVSRTPSRGGSAG